MGDFSLFRNSADSFLNGKRRAPCAVVYRSKGNDLLSRRARNEARKLLSMEDMMILFDETCQLCGNLIEDIKEASRDHIVPVSRGGTSDFGNLQLAHRSCNTAKGSRMEGDLIYDPEMDETAPEDLGLLD